MAMDWVPGVGIGFIGLLGSIAAWLRAGGKREGATEMQMDKLATSDDGLRDDLHSIVCRLDDVAKEMRMVSAQTGSFIASQDVVNRVTARGLENLESKLEKHDSAISDHAATLRLVTELLTRRGGEALK